MQLGTFGLAIPIRGPKLGDTLSWLRRCVSPLYCLELDAISDSYLHPLLESNASGALMLPFQAFHHMKRLAVKVLSCALAQQLPLLTGRQ